MSNRLTHRPNTEANMIGNNDLQKWATKQRKAYHAGKLTPQQIQSLESLPDWTWDEAFRNRPETQPDALCYSDTSDLYLAVKDLTAKAHTKHDLLHIMSTLSLACEKVREKLHAGPEEPEESAETKDRDTEGRDYDGDPFNHEREAELGIALIAAGLATHRRKDRTMVIFTADGKMFEAGDDASQMIWDFLEERNNVAVHQIVKRLCDLAARKKAGGFKIRL